MRLRSDGLAAFSVLLTVVGAIETVDMPGDKCARLEANGFAAVAANGCSLGRRNVLPVCYF